MNSNEKPENIIFNKIKDMEENEHVDYIRIMNICNFRIKKNILQLHLMNNEIKQYAFNDTDDINDIKEKLLSAHPMGFIILGGTKNDDTKLI